MDPIADWLYSSLGYRTIYTISSFLAPNFLFGFLSQYKLWFGSDEGRERSASQKAIREGPRGKSSSGPVAGAATNANHSSLLSINCTWPWCVGSSWTDRLPLPANDPFSKHFYSPDQGIQSVEHTPNNCQSKSKLFKLIFWGFVFAPLLININNVRAPTKLKSIWYGSI